MKNVLPVVKIEPPGVTLVNDPKCRSYTHLVKDGLARPPVIGKDSFPLGIIHPQVLLTQEKGSVFYRERERFLPQKTPL